MVTKDNGVQALKNISLSIGKGMFGLLGQNGAGNKDQQVLGTFHKLEFKKYRKKPCIQRLL
jgi:ABC-type uncharacterized transport system ATPase subunit